MPHSERTTHSLQKYSTIPYDVPIICFGTKFWRNDESATISGLALPYKAAHPALARDSSILPFALRCPVPPIRELHVDP